MFCPHCGKEVEGKNLGFCPYCGQDLSPSITSLEGQGAARSIPRVPSEGGRKNLIIAAVALIAVVAVVCAAFLLLDDGMDDNDQPAIIITVGQGNADGEYGEFIELSGQFSDGTLSAYLDDNGQMVITLNKSAASGFDRFVWTLRDMNLGTYYSRTTNQAEMVWISPDVGRYTITVFCYHDGDDGHTAEYTGYVNYVGDRYGQVQWYYNDRMFSVGYTVSVSEYMTYSRSASEAVRFGDDPSAITTMTTTDGCVSSLESELRRAYEGAFGNAYGYGYADFILSFVHNLTFVYDSVAYGYEDYWAYPAETLYRGAGDSEDLAILYASLCRAAGYEVGYVMLPGHTLAAVSTGQSIGADVPDGYHSQTVYRNGRPYQLAETTEDVPLGCISDMYTYSSGKFSVCGTVCPEWCGLYV